MTTSRHPRSPSRTDPRAAPTDQNDGDPLRWVWLALISALYFMRWWLPTEGTMLGDTLAIAEGWFLALAVAGWLAFRQTVWQVRLDFWQGAVWTMVAGQILSGILVLQFGGDRRAAVNLMWEWTAIGISFPLLRNALGSTSARREWLIVALAGILTLSGYGLTQRYLFYPQMVAEYQRLRSELDVLEENAAHGAFTNLPRIQKLRNDLIGSGLAPHMLNGSGRELFEGRLKHSTEALGRFALANTFAGLLLVWLIILCLLTWRQALRFLSLPPHAEAIAGQRLQLVILIFACGIVGYCLLLTKSRTAFVASCLGIGLYALVSQAVRSAGFRQILTWAFLGILSISVLAGVASVTGGLDRLVIAEAPKSLQYRLEYWWSTLQVIRDTPIIGVGPGQFRQHYLAYKLPRSSEEINDPHNCYLDVWVNGGVISLVGLIGLTWLVIRQLGGRNGGNHRKSPSQQNFRQSSAAIPLPATVREAGDQPVVVEKIPQPKAPQRTGSIQNEVTTAVSRSWTSPFRWGFAMGLLAIWLAGGMVEWLLPGLLVVWIAVVKIVETVLPEDLPSPLVGAVAALSLLLHLCGAGGIAMPAIAQLLLVAVIFADDQKPLKSAGQWANWQAVVVLLSGVGLLILGYVTAVQPVITGRRYLEQGDFALSPAARERNYRFAAMSDPLSEDPWSRLAELAFQKWRNAPAGTDQNDNDEEFTKAIVYQQLAIERNPDAFQTHQALGLYYATHATRTGSIEDHENATREMKIAVKHYPHHSGLLAGAARVFHQAGMAELSKLTAIQALEQDKINRQAGHRDKWLTDSQIQQLNQFAGSQ